MTDAPRGTVTFFFTDIEGSTRLALTLVKSAFFALPEREAIDRPVTVFPDS